MRRIKRALKDALWLFLLPASAALMPWRWYFALCRRVAHGHHPYRAAVEEELRYAQRILPHLDADRFRLELALTKLVDSADFYLAITRGHRWFRRHVDVVGGWPSPDRATLFLGSHWGAATWIWPDLRQTGHRAWFLARNTTAADFGRGRLAFWYGRLRGWGLSRAGAAGVVTIGGARARIGELFARGESLVGLGDVPADAARDHVQVELLDRKVRLPTGLIDLALAHGAAVVWYAMALDPRTGHRQLRIETLAPPEASREDIVGRYATLLDAVLRESPGSWQVWSLAPRLFEPEAGNDAAGDEAGGG